MRRSTLSLAALLAGCSGTEPAPSAPAEAAEDEAGFVELEPTTYAIHHDGVRTELTSSAARLWYAFQPADVPAEDRPLAVFWNGGPGASTGILFGLNTAKRTFDPARAGEAGVAPNPASWSRFADLLYIDARGTGFSYGLAPGAADEAARAAEFTVRSFNPFVDAADVVRVLLRFLAAHPHLRRRPLVLVAESYGGIRASIALDMLLRHRRYEAGESGLEDPALASEIEAHLDALLGEGAGAGATPDLVAERLGGLVLLQPRLSSPHQDAATGALLEAPGSPLFRIAEETGVPFVPCADKPAPCSPHANAMAFLEAAGRDPYDVAAPSGATFAAYAAIEPRFSTLATLEAALGADPTSIEDLYASRRADAYRSAAPAAVAEGLTATFGELAPWDGYHRMELFDLIGAPFHGPEAQALGVERTGPRWGELFLEDARRVRTFVTGAENDAVIYAPAIAPALAMYGGILAGASREGDAIRLRYQDGAERALRVRDYEGAGHSVTLHRPLELASDVEAWLAEPR